MADRAGLLSPEAGTVVMEVEVEAMIAAITSQAAAAAVRPAEFPGIGMSFKADLAMADSRGKTILLLT